MKIKTSEDNRLKDIPPREARRNARKDIHYIEQLDEPGSLYNAEVHGSAQRLLKVHRITKYVKFCRDCSLPQETPGVVVPFNWFDEQLDYGLGIYLYFYYIKFLIVMALICAGLSSVSTIVFSKDYASDIKDYCQKHSINLIYLQILYDSFLVIIKIIPLEIYQMIARNMLLEIQLMKTLLKQIGFLI